MFRLPLSSSGLHSPLYGLRCPASTSCLGRHSCPADRCPNSSSLYPPQAAVVAVARKGLLAPFRPQRGRLHTKKLALRFTLFCVAPLESPSVAARQLPVGERFGKRHLLLSACGCRAATPNRRNEKKSLSEAARFFPLRLPLWVYQGRAALDSWVQRVEIAGAFLVLFCAAKENISGGKAPCKRHQTFPTRLHPCRKPALNHPT